LLVKFSPFELILLHYMFAH